MRALRAGLAASAVLALLALPAATAHIGNATATDLAMGPAEDHTLTFDLTVHPGAGYGVIASLKVAREAGVNFTNASVTFHVVEGPDAEFSANGSRFNLQGDVFAEFRDVDGVEDVVRLDVRFAGVDTTRAWRNGEISHALGAFRYPEFQDEGNATAPFHLAGDPSLEPPPTATTPGPGAIAIAAAMALVVTRARGRPGPSCGR